MKQGEKVRTLTNCEQHVASSFFSFSFFAYFKLYFCSCIVFNVFLSSSQKERGQEHNIRNTVKGPLALLNGFENYCLLLFFTRTKTLKSKC